MKRILLGVSGGIAAYKACELIRLLTKAGAEVKVVMTANAHAFVHKNTFAALTQNQTFDDLFEDPLHHIALAKWAEQIVIAPATAATIGRLAFGMANDLLGCICLATKAPIILVPAMNKVMWENPITQDNLKRLQQYGYQIISPDSGEQACGDVGFGRMAEPSVICQQLINQNNKLKNLTILITAGPTQEKLDPVRCLSNFSSGKMGYALAEVCQRQGARVILISGPTALNPPLGCEFISVENSDDMLDAVKKQIKQADILISAAAVADYKPKYYNAQKIKKTSASLTLELVKTIDILKSIADIPLFKVGFCAETHNVIEAAQKKLMDKCLNAIIVNTISATGYPFNADTNEVTYLNKNHQTYSLAKKEKIKLAEEIINLILQDYIALKVL